MLRIMTHIERLLLVHDCVIIPQVGGFVLQNYPAAFAEENGSFSPARKEIVFNPTLRHNDGLLTESYMKLYGVDYRKALLMQEEDTTELKSVLASKHSIALGAMGTFLVENGSVVFEPGKAAPFSVSSYGLAEFDFPTLKTLQQQTKAPLPANDKKHKDVIYIPVNRKFLRTAVASAAAIVLFLLISTPVKDVGNSTYKASFIPSEVVSKPVIEQFIPEAAPVVTAVAEARVVPEIKKEEVKVTPPPVSKNQKMYHIVIAGFPTKQQADTYLSAINSKEYAQAGIVARDGKFRVYAAKFSDRNDAETYMSKVKNNNKYKDAWLFISR